MEWPRIPRAPTPHPKRKSLKGDDDSPATTRVRGGHVNDRRTASPGLTSAGHLPAATRGAPPLARASRHGDGRRDGGREKVTAPVPQFFPTTPHCTNNGYGGSHECELESSRNTPVLANAWHGGAPSPLSFSALPQFVPASPGNGSPAVGWRGVCGDSRPSVRLATGGLVGQAGSGHQRGWAGAMRLSGLQRRFHESGGAQPCSSWNRDVNWYHN